MKRLLLFTIALVSAFTLHAQESGKFRFGIKGGLNLSNLNTEDADDENMRAAYHAGIFMKLPLNNRFAIQPELLYTIKGSELRYDNSPLTGKATFTLDYIDLAALAVFNITDHLNFHIGPYFGLLSNVRISNDSDQGTTFDFENNLDKNDFRDLDTGIALGLGLDLGKLSVGARYNQGLKKVGKEREFFGQPYTIPDGKNVVIQVYAALSLF